MGAEKLPLDGPLAANKQPMVFSTRSFVFSEPRRVFGPFFVLLIDLVSYKWKVLKLQEPENHRLVY